MNKKRNNRKLLKLFQYRDLQNSKTNKNIKENVLVLCERNFKAKGAIIGVEVSLKMPLVAWEEMNKNFKMNRI